jgi:hypothetical protein
VPESFNVLVKELQGLGLKVDLIDEKAQSEIDAEKILQSNIKDEAKEMPEVEVPTDSMVDVTDDAVADEFEVLDNTAPAVKIVQDDDDDDGDDDNDTSDEGKEAVDA